MAAVARHSRGNDSVSVFRIERRMRRSRPLPPRAIFGVSLLLRAPSVDQILARINSNISRRLFEEDALSPLATGFKAQSGSEERSRVPPRLSEVRPQAEADIVPSGAES
jgi:hypothetical protein